MKPESERDRNYARIRSQSAGEIVLGVGLAAIGMLAAMFLLW